MRRNGFVKGKREEEKGGNRRPGGVATVVFMSESEPVD
jgi:hypothetical protein